MTRTLRAFTARFPFFVFSSFFALTVPLAVGAQLQIPDQCPRDPSKTEPGFCGCGFPESDVDADGVPDCGLSCTHSQFGVSQYAVLNLSVEAGGGQECVAEQNCAIGRNGRFALTQRVVNDLLTGAQHNFARLTLNGTETANHTPGAVSDGGVAVFASSDGNFVSGTGAGISQAYLFDPAAGQVELLSRTGSTPFQSASTPLISADGRFAAFIGSQTPGQAAQPFLVDRAVGTVQNLSTRGFPSCPVADLLAGTLYQMTDTGEVLFSAFCGTRNSSGGFVLVNGRFQRGVFAFNPLSGAVQEVGIEAGGLRFNFPVDPFMAVMSGSGRYVAFHTGNCNTGAIFLRDRQSNTTVRVSNTVNGATPQCGSNILSMSHIGDLVFSSPDPNLVAGDTNGDVDIFLYEPTNPVLRRINLRLDGTPFPAAGYPRTPRALLSNNGRYAAYSSLDGPAGAAQAQLYLWDRVNGDRTRFSDRTFDGLPLDNSESWLGSRNGSSRWQLSWPDDNFSFGSRAGNLVPGDSDGMQDLFLFRYDRDLCPCDVLKTTPDECGCGLIEVDPDGDGFVACRDPSSGAISPAPAHACSCAPFQSSNEYCADLCPADPDKWEPRSCGCGTPDVDADTDGHPDCVDNCPGDGTKTEPGACGCGVFDVDDDGDGYLSCLENCPNDAAKIEPGICGCGTADVDSDGDNTLDCNESCPADALKTEPGTCGCGSSDADSDGDGSADCRDGCVDDSTKTEPGVCGCGTSDADNDSDGTADCNDQCPSDAAKTDAGICGCGSSDTDSDGDGTADCNDHCASDPLKTDPGSCGCGTSDTDIDNDGAPDCSDQCAGDANKTEPGICGCGRSDQDSDGDGSADCQDGCSADPAKSTPGVCGCGADDSDFDGDGSADCLDQCPSDAAKQAPGSCGCGVSDADTDGDGTQNCVDRCPSDRLKVEPGSCGCGVAEGSCKGNGGIPKIKIPICHQSRGRAQETITVPLAALLPHLFHGDYLGECRRLPKWLRH